MRSIAQTVVLLLAMAVAAAAQTPRSGDAALTYHWVRTNTPAGECGCFALNGAGLSGTWNLRPRWALAAEISSEYNGNVRSSEQSLTVTSFMAGARYRLPQPRWKGVRRLQPFAQMLLGFGHAGGGVADASGASYGFVSRLGGGIDVPVGSRFAVRVFQIDYNLTGFSNSTNDHQNNLLLGAGFVYRWSWRK